MIRTGKPMTRDEIGRRGHSLYTHRIRDKVSRQKKGKIVAVDIKSGDYVVADNMIEAADALRARKPKAEIWFERIGFRTAVKMRCGRN
jgi:hypothetical protein